MSEDGIKSAGPHSLKARHVMVLSCQEMKVAASTWLPKMTQAWMVSVEVVARGLVGQLPGTLHCWAVTEAVSRANRFNKRIMLEERSSFTDLSGEK